jgi:hypothetical protein
MMEAIRRLAHGGHDPMAGLDSGGVDAASVDD